MRKLLAPVLAAVLALGALALPIGAQDVAKPEPPTTPVKTAAPVPAGTRSPLDHQRRATVRAFAVSPEDVDSLAVRAKLVAARDEALAALRKSDAFLAADKAQRALAKADESLRAGVKARACAACEAGCKETVVDLIPDKAGAPATWLLSADPRAQRGR